MAGRPAARGGSSGLLYGLIAFAILTVLFAVLFVLTFTKVKGLQEEVATKTQLQSRYGQPPSYYQQEATARNTPVFRTMENEISALTSAISGHAEEPGPRVRDFANRMVNDLAAQHPQVVRPGDSLVSVVQQLGNALQEMKTNAEGLNSEFEKANTQLTSLTRQQETIRQEFESQISDIGERIAEIEKSRDESLAQKDEQVASISADLEAVQQEKATFEQELVRATRDMGIEIERGERKLSDLRGQIRELKPNQFDRDAILKKADGRIMRAIPGSDIVYVNIGEADNAKVGMGLEVYSQTGEQRDTVRGKASLEIVTLTDSVSECRVTRTTPGAPILENDIVLNIAFERNRRPKFVVAGEFDLDYKNGPDPLGRETMEGLIRQWGGQIIDELDESVDYLVIGLMPTVPVSPSGQLTDIVRDQRFQAELESSRFSELVEKANSFGIPVITQNQFLFLTGYAADAPVRRR